jgi:hypothetical protein
MAIRRSRRQTGVVPLAITLGRRYGAYLLACSAAWLACTAALAAEAPELAARKKAWQESLEQRKFNFPPTYSGLIKSLQIYDADAKVQITFDPKDRFSLDYKFMRDGRAAASFKGHSQTAYATYDNKLYYADYWIDSDGCTIRAIDLVTGKELWKTELHQARPLAHSGYGNFVQIWRSRKGEVKDEPEGGTLIVTGQESYCDYIEVLDRQTGESLAVKNYRVGF